MTLCELEQVVGDKGDLQGPWVSWNRWWRRVTLWGLVWDETGFGEQGDPLGPWVSWN